MSDRKQLKKRVTYCSRRVAYSSRRYSPCDGKGKRQEISIVSAESRESAEMPMGYNASRPVMWPTSSSKAHLLKASIIFPNIVPAGNQLSKQTPMANTSHTNHKHHLLTRHLSISWFLLVENTELVHSEHYSVLKCITHNPLWACFLWANPLLGMEELGE